MKMMRWVLSAVLAVGMGVAPATLRAQGVTAANSANAGAVDRALLTSTVHEAWVESGRNEEKFFDMVKQCAELSSQKRGLTLPDTEAAGRKMGMLIKTSARRDPDQLLYAVVDAAVKQTAAPPVKAAK